MDPPRTSEPNPVADVLKLTPTESVAIQASSPDALEVEASYGPNGSPPPKHFHPSQDEHFEVLAGTMRVRVGKEEHELSAGEEIDIPRGRAHQMWNSGSEPARVRWVTSPGLRTSSGSARSIPCTEKGGWGAMGCRARLPSL